MVLLPKEKHNHQISLGKRCESKYTFQFSEYVADYMFVLN